MPQKYYQSPRWSNEIADSSEGLETQKKRICIKMSVAYLLTG